MEIKSRPEATSISPSPSSRQTEGLSPQGRDYLRLSIVKYELDLIELSQRSSARRMNDGIVTSADVEAAERYLIGDSRLTPVNLVGATGGVSLGAGLGNLVSLMSTVSPSAAALVITVALIAIGAALLAFAAASVLATNRLQ